MTNGSGPALRLVFMGTAGFAVPSLRTLARSRHPVVAVYTQPARPAGRGMRPRLSPVQAEAERLGLTVRTPSRLREPAEQAAFAELGADLAVVAAYGLILPAAILDAPRLGCVNLHASLLPRWRGAAPIERALLAGDPKTGVTIIQMEPTLDTGPILALKEVPITATTTAQALHESLATLAARMVVPVIEDAAAGRLPARPQPTEGVVHAPKIDKAEGWLDWSRPAALLERQIRALHSSPGCWTEIAGERLRVHAAEVVSGAGAPGEVLDQQFTVACGKDALRLTRVQRAGGKPLPAEEFLRGFPVPAGSRLGRSCRATS